MGYSGDVEGAAPCGTVILEAEMTKLVKLRTPSSINRETLWRVQPDEGGYLGFVRKFQNTSSDKFPHQAFAGRYDGGPERFVVGDLIGSFYPEDGGKDAAVKAVVEHGGAS